MPILYKRLGGELLVNTTTDGNQSGANIALLADGKPVVVWVDKISLDIRAHGSTPPSPSGSGYVNTVPTGTRGAERGDAAGRASSSPGGPYGVGGDASDSRSGPEFAAAVDKVGGKCWSTSPRERRRSGDTHRPLRYVVSWMDGA